MNEGFVRFMNAEANERIEAFERAAAANDTVAPNVEKDLWVCWTLNFLFNRRPAGAPRLFFKGGTSLSKSFALIRRFSEDIDIGVFKEDIDAPSEEEIAALPSITQRNRAIESRIDEPSKTYFSKTLKPQIESELAKLAAATGLKKETLGVDFGKDKRTDETLPEVLLVRYPSLFAAPQLEKAVRIEGGARPRSTPAQTTTVVPYVAAALDASFGLKVTDVVNIAPERTFWEKVLILHALRETTEKREADGDPQRPVPSLDRISRHYYDVAQIWGNARYGKAAASEYMLAEECRWHKDLMYRSPDHRYDRAVPGTYRLNPSAGMRAKLAADYKAMSSMIFGQAPSFDDIMAAIVNLERFLNVDLKAQLEQPAAKTSGAAAGTSPKAT